jgi:predicted GNAT family acetyltransferase
LPDVVQVGGVYTPPALRGKGHARLALALHLAEARGKGVGRAILYAFSEPAARAYRAIGFQARQDACAFSCSPNRSGLPA